ncbi:hypothetical protein [Staphylococcus epidermidis]|nr:hypothetical protein [Staphylococcus epidermidis]
MIYKKHSDELDAVDLEDFENAQEEYMILKTQINEADITTI